MIELGFCTNAHDADYMLNNVDAIAKGLVEAVLGSSAKPAPKPTPAPIPVKPAESNVREVNQSFIFNREVPVRNKANLDPKELVGVSYGQEETVNLDRIIEGTTYTWGSYISRTGVRRYIQLCDKKNNVWYGKSGPKK